MELSLIGLCYYFDEEKYIYINNRHFSVQQNHNVYVFVILNLKCLVTTVTEIYDTHWSHNSKEFPLQQKRLLKSAQVRTLIVPMRGSRKFCQRGSNSDVLFWG